MLCRVDYETNPTGHLCNKYIVFRRLISRGLTSSRGLSASSSGTVVVLLSLAVAADAGDMLILVIVETHGSPSSDRAPDHSVRGTRRHASSRMGDRCTEKPQTVERKSSNQFPRENHIWRGVSQSAPYYMPFRSQHRRQVPYVRNPI